MHLLEIGKFNEILCSCVSQSIVFKYATSTPHGHTSIYLHTYGCILHCNLLFLSFQHPEEVFFFILLLLLKILPDFFLIFIQVLILLYKTEILITLQLNIHICTFMQTYRGTTECTTKGWRAFVER